MADWANIPCRLVDSIAGFLGVEDQARMAATCKPWRQAMADGRCRARAKPSIWLIFAHQSRRGRSDDRFEFESFSEGLMRRYIFPTPLANLHVLGSSRGYLMLQDGDTRLLAFNPLTNARLSFPVSGCTPGRRGGGIKKALFVHERDEPVMIAIIGQKFTPWPQPHYKTYVALAEPGNGVWTKLRRPSENTRVIDLAAHGGKLYALCKTSEVFVYDVRDPGLRSSPAIKIAVERECDPDLVQRLGMIHGEVVVVLFGKCVGCLAGCFPIVEFLRLPVATTGPGDEIPALQWVEKRDLAGHGILVGYDGIVALPAAEFDEIQANSVYSMNNEGFRCPASLTVENLYTRRMYFRRLSVPYSRSTFWFLPNAERV